MIVQLVRQTRADRQRRNQPWSLVFACMALAGFAAALGLALSL